MRRLRTVRLLSVAMVLSAAGVVVAQPAAADTIRSAQWYLRTLGITQAWSVSRGAHVMVGVVDSGVAGATPDLRGAVVGGKDFSGLGSSNGQRPVGVDLGHGTAVASLLAGRGHGSGHRDGVIGSAPAARILTASVNVASLSSLPQSAAAIRWLVDQGAQVLNVSLGWDHDSAETRAAVAYAEAHDVVVVAGAGNAGPDSGGIGLPAGYPGVIGVSGVDADLRLDPGSSTGAGVALAGPYSTKATKGGPTAPLTGGLPVANPPGDVNGPYLLSEVGTSLATPIVAGIAALIRSRFPTMSAANVINRMIRTATHRGSGTPNDDYGYGVVNAERALTTTTVASVTANPLGSLNPPPESSSASSSSPSASSSPTSSAPTSSPPSGTTTAPTAASSGSSSGIGMGALVAIAAVVVVAAVLIGLLVARDRRRRGTSRPPSHVPR